MSRKFIVLLDTLVNDLNVKVDVLLPGATWVGKSSTFQNAKNRPQNFEQAIGVIGLAKCEGQMALAPRSSLRHRAEVCL